MDCNLLKGYTAKKLMKCFKAHFRKGTADAGMLTTHARAQTRAILGFVVDLP